MAETSELGAVWAQGFGDSAGPIGDASRRVATRDKLQSDLTRVINVIAVITKRIDDAYDRGLFQETDALLKMRAVEITRMNYIIGRLIND